MRRLNTPLHHAAGANVWLKSSPELPTLFGSLTDEREEDDDKAIARLLEDDTILPPNPSRSSKALSEGSLSPAQAELDLLEMCRRVVAKLFIDWPSQQAGPEMERDLYDSKSETYVTCHTC